MLAADETLVCDVVRGWVELSWNGSRWAFSSLASTTVGEASGSSPGIVSTGAQTFAGNKTFNGSITPSGGIVGNSTGTASPAGQIGEVVIFNQITSTNFAGSTTQFANILTLTSANLSNGIWALYGNVSLQQNGATGFLAPYVSISDFPNNTTTDHSYPTQTQMPTFVDSISSPTYHCNLGGCIVNMTGSNTKYIKARFDFASGTPQYRYSIRAVRIA